MGEAMDEARRQLRQIDAINPLYLLLYFQIRRLDRLMRPLQELQAILELVTLQSVALFSVVIK